MSCGTTVDLHRSTLVREAATNLTGAIVADRFRVGERLGTGGMGIVYRCVDVETGRWLALKVMRHERRGETRSCDFFAREIAMLEHAIDPHLAHLVAHGTDAVIGPYIAMELETGEPLASLLERESQLTPIRAALLASQLLRAVGTLHAQHILHGDLKPANVVVRLEGTVERCTIIDFGLAHVVDQQHCDVVSGTPAYMAPELSLGDPTSFATDQYAIGIILYEMLTGTPPFLDEHGFAALERQLKECPPRPSWVAGTPLSLLDSIVLRSLAKDPAQRYPDVSAMARSLDHYIAIA